MSSLRQIEANRRNGRLSTGPITEEGKTRSRRNALRHGLTAETVIEALEDADDYAAFEMAVTADYDAQSAVERELVLRLASLLWRLRRATAIEAGLFKEQARQLLQFRQERRVHRKEQSAMTSLRRAISEENGEYQSQPDPAVRNHLSSPLEPTEQCDGLTRAFVGLTNLPTYPLDRLSRYETALWRQACQILFTLRFLDRRKPWERLGR